jgi:hypothetical protein
MSVSTIKRTLFQEISKNNFDKQYTQQERIGAGSQGDVFKANFNGQTVAIKNFKKECVRGTAIKYIKS